MQIRCILAGEDLSVFRSHDVPVDRTARFDEFHMGNVTAAAILNPSILPLQASVLRKSRLLSRPRTRGSNYFLGLS